MQRVLLIAAFVCAVAAAVPPLPTFPSSYKVNGRFSLIPVGTPEMEFYNLTIYYDAAHGGRQDYNWGLHTIIQSIADQFTYELILYNGQFVCVPQNNSGPSLHEHTHLHMMAGGRANAMSIQSAFPVMTGFVYKGDVFCPGSVNDKAVCHQFEKTDTILNKTNVYEFYTHVNTGFPYLYEFQGFDELLGSHYDHYRFYYDNYYPGFSNPSELKKPAECTTVAREDLPSQFQKNTVFHKLHNVVPSAAHQEYKGFVSKYSKNYKNQEEYNLRLLNFANGLHFVNEHNANPASTHTVAINHMADAHEWEWRMMFGLVSTKHTNALRVHAHDPTVEVPAAVDWRMQNVVSPVKDQGFCGSCWSFSTTGALESAYYIKHKQMTQLSQQYLVDCATNAGMGCDGGDQGPAYDYIRMNNGIPTQVAYGPYRMINEICHNATGQRIKITGYVNITANDENAMKQAVATVGPVAVSIDASQYAFRYYASGVFYAPQCSSTNLDHAVLAVGYGTENGQDYWWVKNSWSTYWGDGGYVKMARNRNNNCGIASASLYPIPV
jgi:C1A family cysteine protease